MATNVGFSLSKTVPLSFDEAVIATKAALKTQGFGVLTEIDVKKTMAEKLGVDVPAHLILGACNPPLAHRALTAEPDLGLLLPCNVTVRQDGQKVLVSAIDPLAMLSLVDNATVRQVAEEARKRLEQAIADLPGA